MSTKSTVSADKRTVHTDALDTLGMIITQDERRDAIHLAVEPVQADKLLVAGQEIGFMKNGKVSNLAEKKIGIVDPFVKEAICRDDWFWLVVYPRQITSLRHVWTHPDFEKTEDLTEAEQAVEQVDDVELEKRLAEKWLRDFAAANRIDFEFMIESTRYGGQEYIHSGSLEIDAYFSDDYYEWLEKYTGEPVDDEYGRVRGFSCAC